MTAFLLSLALVFAAEFGDKTQLVALAFATRYSASVVLIGITIAALVDHFFSVVLGEAAGNLIPQTTLNLIAGLAFIGFGVAALRTRQPTEQDKDDLPHHRFGPLVSVTLTFLIAELGDKTMLATVAIAGQQRDFMGVWLGSSAGMILAGALAIALGRFADKRVPDVVVRWVGALIFLASGIGTLARAALAG